MIHNHQPAVAFVMPVWGKASEQFFMRQIKLLADANMLKLIILTGYSNRRKWRHIPIISLSGHSVSERAWRYLNRKYRSTQYAYSPVEKLKKILRHYQIDTLLIQYGPTAVAIKEALDASRQRIFVHVHGYDTQEESCPAGHIEAFRKLSTQSTIICNSNETFRRLSKWGISKDNLVVKYMGVEIPEIVPQTHSRFTILSLGRLVDCKSPDRTIQAFELACEKGLNAELILAGDGPLKVTCELLRVRSRWKDAIKLPGEVTWQQGEILRRQADMFTQHAMVGELTGRVEAFGVSIIEAMASALPVSTCKVGGIGETVIENETGLFFEPKNIEQQADTFIQLANNPELRMLLGKNARQRVIDHFSLEIEARRLLDILTMQKPGKP